MEFPDRWTGITMVFGGWDMGAYEYVNSLADSDHDGMSDAGRTGGRD